MKLNSIAFEKRKDLFLRHMPSFSGFPAHEKFNKEERDYKVELVALVRDRILPLAAPIISGTGSNKDFCQSLYDIMCKVRLPSTNVPQNLASWRTWEHLRTLTDEQAKNIALSISELITAKGDPADVLDRSVALYNSALTGKSGTASIVKNVLTLLLFLSNPASEIYIRTELFDRAGEELFGEKLGGHGRALSAENYRRAREFAKEVYTALQQQNFQPRDLIDVQSFLFIAYEYDQLPGSGLLTQDEDLITLPALLAKARDPKERRLLLRVRVTGDDHKSWQQDCGLEPMLPFLHSLLKQDSKIELTAEISRRDTLSILDANELANSIWLLRSLEAGDVVVAAQDDGLVLALGLVEANPISAKDAAHLPFVFSWYTESFPKKIKAPLKWSSHPVCELPRDLYVDVLQEKVAEVESLPDFETILGDIQRRGFRTTSRDIGRYHTALQSRKFVILSGISGTGKTWLAQAYAEAVGAACKLVPVAPNWTSNEDLLGYLNPLTQTFQSTEFTRFAQAAANEWKQAKESGRPPRQYHLVLDEMNLARVEYYFAKFLSAMEVRSRNGEGEIELYNSKSLQLTPNLFFIGTVNIDETTHGFADKVFDRAQMIELHMARENIALHLQGQPYESIALDIWDCMKDTFPFAYRVLDDISSYVGKATEPERGLDWRYAFDEQVLQKILPKIKGSDPQLAPMLERLQGILADYPLSLERVKRMQETYHTHGFTSYF